MASAFFKITSALIALLQADPPVSPAIYRARERAVPEKAETAVNVQWNGAIPESGALHGSPIDWHSSFSIECFARSRSLVGDEAVDPLLEAVYERIGADPTLGGLVADISAPNIEADFDAEGEKTGWIRLTYQVQHRTANSTLD